MHAAATGVSLSPRSALVNPGGLGVATLRVTRGELAERLGDLGSVWIVDPGDLIGAAPCSSVADLPGSYHGVAKEFGSATPGSSP